MADIFRTLSRKELKGVLSQKELHHTDFGDSIAAANPDAPDRLFFQKAVRQLFADASQHFSEIIDVNHIRKRLKHSLFFQPSHLPAFCQMFRIDTIQAAVSVG